MDHFDIAENMTNMYNKINITIPYRFDSNHILEKICLQIIKVAVLPAQKMFFQVCAKIVENIKEIIHSNHFLSRHRFSEKDFTRDRKLPFSRLIYHFINFNKRAYQDELDSFFKLINNLEIDEREVTKGALSIARQKLKYEAFIELNRHLNAQFYLHFKTETWNGYNLYGIDGSTLRVPKDTKTTDHFGTWKPKNGEPCPIARISQMFDVLNKVTLDAVISPKETGERELAAEHLALAGKDDLILLDRGYPAFWLFKMILLKQANFCARVPITKWKRVHEFYQSGKAEDIVLIHPSYPATRKCHELGLDKNPIPIRFVRVELENGETEILMTSLTDIDRFPHCVFDDLYHLRWPVEEDYKTMKCRMEAENFSGKSVLSVYQDFHAKVFSKNLTAVLAFPANKTIEKQSAQKRYVYQLNFTQALSRMKDAIVLLFLKPGSGIVNILKKLNNLFVKTIEPIRPGRKYPRKSRVQKKGFYVSYKPIR